jgi:hypothetical protein
VPPSGGIPLQNRFRWSRKCPRVPREHSPSLGHVTDVPRVIPDSACFGAAIESLRGASLRTLISKGLGARVLWGGRRTPQGATFEPLISRRARGLFPSLRRTPSKYPVSRSLRRDRKRKEKKKGDISKRCGAPYFEAFIMIEAKRRSPACQRRRVSCQGVNVTGRATHGVPVARARVVRGTEHGCVVFML